MAIEAQRLAAVRLAYKAVRPFVLGAKGVLGGRIQTLADIGCGDGIMTALVTQDVRPDFAVLVDLENSLEIPTVGNVWFKKLDVCNKPFITELKDKVHLMTCFFSFHEFAEPLTAMRHMVEVLPRHAGALIIDHSEEGWTGLGRIIHTESQKAQRHYEEDLQRIAKTSLGTNSGIREFWEESVRPNVEGRLIYSNNGTVYTVLYIKQ